MQIIFTMDILTAFLITIISMNIQPNNQPDVTSLSDQSGMPFFTFGIITDVQYCNCEAEGTRFYRESTWKLREAMNAFRADSVSFVINLGDLIDHDIESYKPVINILDSSGLKVYSLTGNHDYSVETRYKKRLPVAMPTKEGYYSFVVQNFRFIALNGNEISSYAGISKAFTNQATEYLKTLRDSASSNANDWNGGISVKQLQWLKSQLDESVLKNEKVFLLCHFPVFPEGPFNLLNYREVDDLLVNYHNIIVCFSGHNHSGGYGNFNLIHFVTIKGMVETENLNSFAKVEVYGNRIWITGSGREKSQILAY
jgi:manganese-dependent ADP-ribose/CDP-alcohol diphosphatase